MNHDEIVSIPGLTPIQQFRYFDNDSRLKVTFGIVESTSFEQLALWREWSLEHNKDNPNAIEWVQINDGCLVTIGHVNDRPVTIGLHWNFIAGQPVLFYDTPSQIVDFVMVEKWLEEQLPQVYDRRCFSNAMNFHIVVHKILGF